MAQKNEVAVPGVEYREMSAGGNWELLEDLLGGTARMREKAAVWLPSEPLEKFDTYENRVKRSFLFNGFKKALDNISAKPFGKEVQVIGDENLPDELKDIQSDVDLAGRTITQFAHQAMKSGLTYGKFHIYVDFPNLTDNLGDQPLSLQEERELGVRPTFVLVRAPDLIGWRTRKGANGEKILTQIRFKESEVESIQGSEFSDQEVERIRVVNEPASKESNGTFQIWEKNVSEEDGEIWVKVQEGEHSFPGIPLVTVYFDFTGFLTATPPLKDLAWINLEHFQSSSDQRNILRFARVPILFLKGFTKEDAQGIALGPSMAIRTEVENSDVKYVEHSGDAIKAGQEDLEALEHRMEVMGIEPFVQRPGNPTATGIALDASKAKSLAQAWVRAIEAGLIEAYKLAGVWISNVDFELPADFRIDIFNDFGITLRGMTDAEQFIKMRTQGLISEETFLTELQRRGMFGDTFDVDEERGRIASEPPPLDPLLDTPVGEDPPPQDEEEEEDDDE